MPVEVRKDTIAFIVCVNNELYFEECKLLHRASGSSGGI